MRKPIYTLILLFTIALCTQAQEQVPENMSYAGQNARNNIPATTPQPLTNAMGMRMVAESYYKYDALNSVFAFIDSSEYTYSGAHTGDAVNTPRYDTRMVYKPFYNTPTIMKATHYSATFDQYDNRSSLTINQWNWIDHTWDNDTLISGDLDRNNRPRTDTVYAWNKDLGIYFPSLAWSYGWFNNGLLAAYASYLHFDTGWERLNNVAYLYYYDQQQNLIEWNLFVSADRYGANDKHTYAYNSNNQLLRDSSFDWEKTLVSNSGRWVRRNLVYYTYNGSGFCSEQLVCKWQKYKVMYDTIGRYDYSYDFNNDLSETIFYAYKGNGVFEEENRYQYTNNAYHQRTSTSTQTWNGSTWEITAKDIWRYYYYAPYFPTGIAQQPQASCIKLYPNPAGNILYVDGAVQACYITNVQGRVVMQVTDNSEHKSIDVSALPAGNYVFTVSTGNITEHHKFTILR
ncbi:MAG: T9SS type A sorting domain-containing protein [Sphingobacteriales bacterium]|nr:MAG: T9SS type A sorting domain-containing protein [Sphingobacteriales bacterium]